MSNQTERFLYQDIEHPEEALSLAWVHATMEGDGGIDDINRWEAVNALVNLSRELREVRNWRVKVSR